MAQNTVKDHQAGGQLSGNGIAAVPGDHTWPVPHWFSERNHKQSRLKQHLNAQTYRQHVLYQLQDRYLKCESDFCTVCLKTPPQDPGNRTATRVYQLLQMARQTLEQEPPNLQAAASALDLAERFMVWFYPDWGIKSEANKVLCALRSVQPSHVEVYTTEISRLLDQDEHADPGYRHLRTWLDQAIGAINESSFQQRMSTGLQFQRLSTLRNCGLILLGTLLFAAPSATGPVDPTGQSVSEVGDWSILVDGLRSLADSYVTPLLVALMGACGGFLSGLLQARDSRVRLEEFLENKLKLQLKPLLGAILALLLYIFLSWRIVAGVSIENVGSYLLLAFVAGFSERVFLQLLKLKSDVEVPEIVRTAEGVQPVPSSDPAPHSPAGAASGSASARNAHPQRTSMRQGARVRRVSFIHRAQSGQST